MGKQEVLNGSRLAAGSILSLSLFLHITVLCLLRRVRRGLTNQRLLIMNLCLTELFFIPPGIFYFFPIPGKTVGSLMNDLATVGFSAFALNCYLANAFMIVDRALAGIIPLRYRSLFTSRRVKIAVVALWLPFLFVPLFYVLFGYDTFIGIMILMVIALDFFMLVTAFLGYGYVYFAIRKRKRTFKWNNSNAISLRKMANRQQVKVFKVAAPVIATFFLFVVVPDIVSIALGILKIEPVYYRKLFYTFPTIDILVDPLLFLYQYPPLRHEFQKLFGLASEGSLSVSHTRDRNRSSKSTLAACTSSSQLKISVKAESTTSIQSKTSKADISPSDITTVPVSGAKQRRVSMPEVVRSNQGYLPELSQETLAKCVNPSDPANSKQSSRSSLFLSPSYCPKMQGSHDLHASETELSSATSEILLNVQDTSDKEMASSQEITTKAPVSCLENLRSAEKAPESSQMMVPETGYDVTANNERNGSISEDSMPLTVLADKRSEGQSFYLALAKKEVIGLKLFSERRSSAVFNETGEAESTLLHKGKSDIEDDAVTLNNKGDMEFEVVAKTLKHKDESEDKEVATTFEQKCEHGVEPGQAHMLLETQGSIETNEHI